MDSIPISKPKIIPPRRREEILTRKRLLDMLFEALDRKLVLISAPAGYGKTSLLIDLAQKNELPVCWLALDELDRDPQRFIAYFIASITERFPNFGNQSLSLLNRLASFEQQDMERLVVTLVNEIYEQINEHLILVLDDFHLLDGVQPVQAFLNRFIQLVGENFHLVISSRGLTAPPYLPRLVARDQVSGLGMADLAFHAYEIQALLEQNQNRRISDQDAERLIAETEGWITALQHYSGMPGTRPAMMPGAGLFDFLGQEVLDQQTPGLREFLLRTSLLEEFDAPLCKTVLSQFYREEQDWQGWINTIINKNLFTLPVDADGHWVRYHHLFRDFLQTRLEGERPQEVKPILIELGRAYEKLEKWEEAHHVCEKLRDAEALAGMIERSGTPMLQHAFLTLEAWLRDLPPSILGSRPGLLSIRGMIAHRKGDLQKAMELLNKAVQSFREEKNDPGLTLSLVRRGSVHRLLGDYPACIRDAEEVIRLTEASDELQSYHGEALRVKGLALYRLGHARESVKFLEQSLDVFTGLRASFNMAMLLMETGIAYRAAGNYTEARTSYEKALNIWRKDGNLTWQANVLNNLGVLYYFQGEYEAAAQVFEEGLLCARRSKYTRMEALISIGVGDLYAEIEDFSIAEQNYHYAAQLIEGMDDQFLIHILALAEANLALLQDCPSDARKRLDDAAASIEAGKSLYENGLLNLLYGRLALAEGKAADAIHPLEQAEHYFANEGYDLEGGVARFWRAVAHHANGNAAAAIEKLKTVTGNRKPAPHSIVVAVHQARGLPNDFGNNPEVRRAAGDLFTRGGRHSGKLPMTRRQLRRQAQVIEMPAPYLTIQTLGHVIVSFGGKPLAMSDWQTKSIRDLFFFFLNARKPVTKEQVGAALWPDLYEPAQLKLRFKNEMYRLRRAVGQDTILFEDVFYSFNRNMDYEYDVDDFESFVAKARSSTKTEEQIAFYQKAVELVRGPYLEDMDVDWAIPERERLNQVYLSALLSLADLLVKTSQPEKSLAPCQRAMEYEPTYEAAYRLTMEIYQRLGNRGAVMRTYQSYKDAMERVLDLPPSDEMQELYRTLTK